MTLQFEQFPEPLPVESVIPTGPVQRAIDMRQSVSTGTSHQIKSSPTAIKEAHTWPKVQQILLSKIPNEACS